MDVPIYGIVSATTYVTDSNGYQYTKHYGSASSATDSVLTNSTVKIYFVSQQEDAVPVLIWETTADGGSFNEVMTIDTVYYRATGKHYVVEIEAMLDGQLCINTIYNSRAPITLSELASKESWKFWVAESDEYYEQFLKQPRS